jgi:hypothetical protein
MVTMSQQNAGRLTRTPPADVRRQLRQEVGFGCPVENCGNPYLTYHHFDPPFSVEQHHDPNRMIALCWPHHNQVAAWTVADFYEMKRNAPTRDFLRGRFEWMKHDVLTIAGGNFYYRNQVAIQHQSAGRLIWMTRDERERMLLNLRMLHTKQSTGTVSLDENDWTVVGSPSDLASPPSGRSLKVAFPSGDKLSILFTEHPKPERIAREYERTESELRNSFSFPLVTAEITMAMGGTDLNFGTKSTTFQNGSVFKNCTVIGGPVGMMFS